MPECFIIMPISTPDFALDRYNGDDGHFIHVLEHLFVPAISKAGYNPVRPIMQGSDLIQGEIIKNLESADMVLCDISILNPNVFFELGVRTAVNKPVSLVKDDKTPRIPFDTGMINHHTYNSGLNAWELESDINQLSEHIKACFERSDKQNSLWKYFSLNLKADTLEKQSNSDEQFEYLSRQLNAIRTQLIQKPEDRSIIHNKEAISPSLAMTILEKYAVEIGVRNATLRTDIRDRNKILFYLERDNFNDMNIQNKLIKRAEELGIKLVFSIL